MPNLGTRVLLFLSSYAPLLVILGVRNAFGHMKISYVLFGVAALSILGLVIYLSVARRLTAHEIVVQQAVSKDGEAMSYIVTYLLPFLAIDSGNRADQISLAIVLLMLAVLYISSNLIHMNPMLNLGGYRILELDSQDGKRCTLITKRAHIRAGASITAVSLSDSILLEKP